MSFLGLDLASTNYSYYSIPAAFLITMAPNVYAMVLAGKNYDLNQYVTHTHTTISPS